MKLFLIHPDDFDKSEEVPPFHSVFENGYAKKFIKHLIDDRSVCTFCGKSCINCRKAYGLNFKEEIAGVHKLSAKLLYYIDDPAKYLPNTLPFHDILIAINIHEDILLALPKAAKEAGAKGLIVPCEHPDWLTRWGRGRLTQICNELGLECAFPKPFCALTKSDDHPTINEFIDHFMIGRPVMKIETKDGVIEKATIKVSAPCGATYLVAHKLKGVKLDDDIDAVVAKYWHSYPCIASMKTDPELGDTILHKAGHIHYGIVREALGDIDDGKL